MDANFSWVDASHYPTLLSPWPPRPSFFPRVTVVPSRRLNKCLPQCRQLSRKCAPIPRELSRYGFTRSSDIASPERCGRLHERYGEGSLALTAVRSGQLADEPAGP